MNKLTILECKRCGYKWVQKGEEAPGTCANRDCRSPYWNKERRKRVRKSKQEGASTPTV